jgi:thiol-disulfide isomerase/thioredoxin
MIKILTFSLLFLIFQISFINAQINSIDFFKGSIEEVLELGKSPNKYVFIDCFTEWCGPCKDMDKNVFKNDSVANFYNKNFINYKLDIEKGEGPSIKKKYGIGFYPTFLFLKNNGDVIHRSIGARTSVQFIKLGKDAADTNSNFYAREKKYYKGQKNQANIYNYAVACYEAGVGFDANEYFVTQNDDSLLNEKNWFLISIYTSQTGSREFRYLTKNRKKFSEKYSEYFINEKILKVLENELALKSSTEKDKNVDFIINEILSPVVLDNKDVFKYRLKMFYYQNLTGNMSEFIPVATQYITFVSPKHMNTIELNSICRDIYLNTNDLNILDTIERWLKECVKKDDNFYIYDTYAQVLFKTGKFEESLKAAYEAIKIAENIHADCTMTKTLVERIKNIKN